MKIGGKFFISMVGIFLIFLGGFIFGQVSKTSPPANPTASPDIFFKVTRVVDGDTIEIEGGEKIRYIGIDTPETVDPRKPVQCFGIEASKKNKELVEGKTVRLEKDITDRDKYSRLLRYVWIDDLFVNLELIKQGFATSYTYPPDIKYQEEFLAAEKEARVNKLGLWEACPIVASPMVKLPLGYL